MGDADVSGPAQTRRVSVAALVCLYRARASLRRPVRRPRLHRHRHGRSRRRRVRPRRLRRPPVCGLRCELKTRAGCDLDGCARRLSSVRFAPRHMSTSRTPISAQENTLLRKMLEAMSQRAPSEDDRKRLRALGAAVRGRREELGMTPAELACVSGIRREQLEAIEAGRPYPGQRGAGHRMLRFSWEPRR